jgi:hypothetical protein
MYDHAKLCAALVHAPFHLSDPARAVRAGQIVDLAAKHDPDMDLRFFAYDLATAFWETQWTLAPRREIDEGRGKPYGIANPHTLQVYYGRGLVQTTWYANYLKLSRLLGIDCINHPDLLLQMDYAAPALFAALEQGLYTGRKLSEFFNMHNEDPVGARACVNGHDKAQTIAALYKMVKQALVGARS